MLVTFLLRLRSAERGDWKYRDHLRRHKQAPEIDTNLSNIHWNQLLTSELADYRRLTQEQISL